MTQETISKLVRYTLFTAFGAVAGAAVVIGLFPSAPPAPITHKKADSLLYDYLKYDGLRKAMEYTYGGTFPKDAIYKSGDTAVGVRLWYCYNKSDTLYPKVFLAAEKVSSYAYPKEEDKPASDNLTIGAPFYNRETSVSRGDAISDLRRKKEEPGTPFTISKDKVIEFSTEFRLRTKHLADLKYKYCFFFYDNTNDFKKLLTQTDHSNRKDITYIRYYFGFDKDESLNDLRVILLGANSKAESVAEENSLILQKSVPPPPDL
jgi:hypothetical protein